MVDVSELVEPLHTLPISSLIRHREQALCFLELQREQVYRSKQCIGCTGGGDDTPEDVWWEGDSPYSKRVGKNESKDDVLPVLGALRVPEYCDLLTGNTCDLRSDSSTVSSCDSTVLYLARAMRALS